MHTGAVLLNLTKLPEGVGLLNWNDELPSSTAGDPLGMTLRIGARLGAELLHCITSITPRARYYSFFPWAFQRAHAHSGGTTTFGEAMDHVLINERAMTLGAVLHHEGRSCEGGALQGSNRAVQLATGQQHNSIDLAKWNHLRDRTSGFDAYKGSLINLGVFEEASTWDDEVEEAGEEQVAVLETGKLSSSGQRLADAFDRAVAKAAFLALKPGTTEVTFDTLADFGRLAGLCELRDADAFDLVPLREMFFAADIEDRHNSHYRRRMTLMLLLWAVDITHAAGHELMAASFDDLTFYRAIFSDENEPDLVVPPEPLADILERWRIFHFHNYLTSALESLLAATMRAILYHPAGRTISEILDAFGTAQADEDLGKLLGVGLPSPFMDMTPAQSLELLGIDRIITISDEENGAAPFEGNPFAERILRAALIEDGALAGPSGAAAASLLVYMLVLRYDRTVHESHRGWNAMKVVQPQADVSMPTVVQGLLTELGTDWWNRPNREVMSRLLNKFVVRQHETMSYEKGYGGSPALFRIDGMKIIGTDLVRDDVKPGNARFPSAMQVLKDLRLIASDPEEGTFLTADGRSMLESFLASGAS